MVLAKGEGPKRPDLITVTSSCVRVAHIFLFYCPSVLGFLANPCSHKCSEIIFGRQSNNPLEQHAENVIGSFAFTSAELQQFLQCF